MNATTIAVLVIGVSGAFGGMVVGMVRRSSHKLRLPFFDRLVEIGFFGDAFVGAVAAIGAFLFVAPLLGISPAEIPTLAQEGAGEPLAAPVDIWIKIIGLSVLAGIVGVRFLTGTSSHVLEKVGMLEHRLEHIEKREAAGELVRQADVLVAENQLEHALSTYDEALSIDPGHEGALLGKATVFAQRGQWDKAIHAASRILDFHPASKRAFYHRACYKNMAGKYAKEEVLQDLQAAIALDRGYKNYAALHDRHFESLRSDETFRRIVE